MIEGKTRKCCPGTHSFANYPFINPFRSRSLRISWLLALLLALSFLVGREYYVGVKWENSPSLFGTRDFCAFWAGFDVWRNGGNPYSLKQVGQSQFHVLPSLREQQAFLNPPWALPLLAPFLSPPFFAARSLWIAWNIFFLVAIVVLARSFLARRVATWKLLLTTIPFLPVLMTVWMGQLSLLITLALLLCLYLLQKRKEVLAGALLVTFTLKPQLLYLPGLVIFWLLLRERRWRVFLSFALTLSLLCTLAKLISPPVFANWLSMRFSPLMLKTSTVATMIREAIFQATGVVVVWPVYLLPAIAVLGTAIWVRSQATVSWGKALPVLVTTSLIFAPYAWLYDYVLLLIPYLFLAAQGFDSASSSGQKVKVWLWLGALQILLLIQAALTKNLMYFFWFPLAMLLAWNQCQKAVDKRS